MTRNLILAAASMLALSACTVGPRYVSPVPAAPSQAPFLEAGKSPAFSGEQPPGPWWSLFGDPLLDQLVGEALTANTDLRVAAANLAQARRSVLAVSASPTSWSSNGSPNRLHHGPGGCSPLKAGDLPASRKGACDGAAGPGET